MVGRGRVAVIPARGGSKRIKRKNIIEFHGKPLIGWTIEAALNSNLFDDVIVSTEDEEIASISRESGAAVPFLRENHSDDFTPISIVTAEVMQRLKLMGREYEVVVQLMANCPLRNTNDIKDAVAHFDGLNAPAQISCFRYGWMNPWWAVELNEFSEPISLFPEVRDRRSQDLPPLFCPTGAIWIAKSDVLQTTQNFYCSGHVYWEISQRSAIDIDDESDLQMAKALFSLR